MCCLDVVEGKCEADARECIWEIITPGLACYFDEEMLVGKCIREGRIYGPFEHRRSDTCRYNYLNISRILGLRPRYRLRVALRLVQTAINPTLAESRWTVIVRDCPIEIKNWRGVNQF